MYSALLLAHYYNDYKLLPVECALNHHEDMLGTGYPRGVIVDRIEIQIVKFADTFDALIAARPFRNYFSLDDAFLISEAEIKLGNLDASLLPLVRSYHLNFKTIFQDGNIDMINSGNMINSGDNI
jgi:HD-GYP domain-containing protein (c-di-GMP phosphodiesterase class II)